MYILRRKTPYIIPDVLDANTYCISENVDIFKKTINQELNFLNSVVNKGYDDLFKPESIDLLRNIYYITYEEDDYLKLLAFKYHNKYRMENIVTKMTFPSIKAKDYEKCFIYENQLYQICYKVAVPIDYKIDNNKIYSKDEIEKMIKSHECVIIEKKKKEIDNLDFEKENYEVNFDDNGYHLSQFINNNLELFCNYLQKYISKGSHYENLRQYVSCLMDAIDEFLRLYSESSNIGYSDIIDLKIIELCNNWFNQNNIEDEIEKIEKKINQTLKENAMIKVKGRR